MVLENLDFKVFALRTESETAY